MKKPTSSPSDRTFGNEDFPIVGIGCSAGGLDALEKFLSHVPDNSRMAFVIVQHLAPDYASALPELLRRFESPRVPWRPVGLS